MPTSALTTLLRVCLVHRAACDQWTPTPLASMSQKRSGLGVAALDGKVYAVGGETGHGPTKSVEVYDPITDHWAAVASMTNERKTFTVAALGGKLYAVCGGSEGFIHFGPAVEAYDPSTNQWTAVPGPNTYRIGAGVAALNGKLYAAGGHHWIFPGFPVQIFHNTVEAYDPETNKWTNVASMSTKRNGFTLVATSGKLYAVGGRNEKKNLNSVEAYDPATDKWTLVASMSVGRAWAGVAAVDDRIFAIGGLPEDSVERYDVKSDQWTILAKMNTSRYLLGAAALDGKVYAVGGEPDQYNAKAEAYDVQQLAPAMVI